MPLTASPADQALLLDLQKLDTTLQQVAHRLANLPEIAVLSTLEGDTARLRSRLASEHGAWEDAQTELRRVESDVSLVETRIARDEQRLAGSSSSKDAQALQGELATLGKRRADLEEVQLEVMERVEGLGAVVSTTESELAELEIRRRDAETSKVSSAAELETERTHVVRDRELLAGKVPAELLALYERQRQRYGVGASLLRGGVSSASGVALTGSDLARVRAAARDEVILCPDSDAILVRTDESGI